MTLLTEEQARELKDSLRRPFLTVFLDGRNEHGSHALPVPGDSLGDSKLFDEVRKDLEDQGGGLAEQIIAEAEQLGHQIGQFVVTHWIWNKHEFGNYFEYAGIDQLLTELMCGTPAEQDSGLADNPEEES